MNLFHAYYANIEARPESGMNAKILIRGIPADPSRVLPDLSQREPG
jgi:hypothetical protein